jgi:hypothetical protein
MPLGAPALVRTDHYTTMVALHGPDNSLMFFWNNDGDSTWNPSVIAGAGTTFAAPAMSRTGDSESTVIAAMGPDHSLNFYWNNDGDPAWHGSVIAGPRTTYGAPSIWRTNSGSTIVLAQGPGNRLSAYYNYDGDPVWFEFEPLENETTDAPLKAFSVPTLVGEYIPPEGPGDYSNGAYVIGAAFVGPDNFLNFASGYADQTEGYGLGDYVSQLGPAYGMPAVQYNSSNSWVLVAVRGLYDSLDYYWAYGWEADSPVWNPSVIAGPGSIYSPPSMGRTDHNSTVIAAMGPENSLVFFWNNDGDFSWIPSTIAGAHTTYSAPVLGRVKNESTIIAVRGPHNQLLFYWNNDGNPSWNKSVIATL